jgi:hypothetical protein
MASGIDLRTWAAAVFLAATTAAQESASNFKAAIAIGDSQTHLRALLDYDGDGATDAVSVYATPGAATGTLRGYRNLGGDLVLDWSLPFAPPGGPFYGGVLPTLASRVDLDGDGLDDFVVAAGAFVAAYSSGGAGVPPTQIWSWTAPGPAYVYALTSSDFDADGVDDVAVATFLPATVQVLFSTVGAGTPAIGPAFPLIGVHAAITTIDVDGVPPREIAIAANTGILTGGTVTVLGLTPGGGFTALNTFSAPGADIAVAAGDLDGDGDQDLLITDRGLGAFSPSTRRAALNQGGTLVSQPATSPTYLASFLFDVDGDGDLDAISGSKGGVATGSRGVADFYLTLHDATGTPISGFGVAASDDGAIGVADLDGDGDGDVVTPRSVYYSGGGVQPPFPHGAALAARVDLFDVEGDGDFDFSNAPEETVRNDGRGVFSAFAAAPISGPGYFVVGRGVRLDVDGDGDVDQLVTTATSAGGVPNATRLRLNRGDGVLVDVGAAAVGSIADFGGGATLPGVGPESAFTADLDGDGDLDVLVSGVVNGVAYARPWLSNGAGALVAGTTIVGFAAGAVADFDGDALPDLVGFASAGGQGVAEVRRNLGAGSFLAPTAPGGWPALTGPLASTGRPAVGDFDGDGLREVCIVEKPTGAPAYARTFEFAGATFAASAPFAVEVDGFVVGGLGFAHDVDGDGAVDILLRVEATNAGATSVLLRTASGFSSPRVEYADAYGVADLDDDGDVDLVGAGRTAFGRRSAPFAYGHRIQYGEGSAGTGGVTPTFGASGRRRSSSVFSLRIRGAVGGASGLIAAGVTQLNTPLFGSTLLVSPDVLLPFTTSGASGVAGVGTYDFTFTVPPGIAGVPFFHQAAVADPSGPSGLTFTNGLLVIYGP